jgi:hypothetical protein
MTISKEMKKQGGLLDDLIGIKSCPFLLVWLRYLLRFILAT